MIADVAAIPGADVWGVDRTLSSVLPLERLLDRAREPALRVHVEEHLAQARAFNREHLLLRDTLLSREPERILELVRREGWSSDPDCRWMLERLEMSARNMRLYRNASPDNADGYLSNLEREEAMVEALLRHARASGIEAPRVVLKLGHYHAIRGLSWSNVFSVGNVLDGLARANDLRSFHVDVNVINRPGQHWSLTDFPEYAPLAAAGSPDRCVLVDLRPLRGLVHSGALAVSDELRRRIFGFDAALLIGDTRPGTIEWAAELVGEKDE